MLVSSTVPALRTILKLGASNLFNTRYFTNYGSPEIGAVYYLQLTFDEFLR